MAIFKGIATEKSQRKPNRQARKKLRTRRTKIQQMILAKVRAQGKR